MNCPICDRPVDTKYRPFCSKRCADRDLGKWLTGGYAIPSDSPDDVDDIEREMQESQSQKPH
ncbi:DNA gyrase inhibitor YacG [Yoonia sp. 2307UL14-13]|uniref:DNA gyrase inhibitor YacG n=1 Tax=Yoonia sp. 2307UL14-13 TaxID=3126506 RepID=UPI0030AB4AF3